ncbi:MAG: VRR-NUC domain protein [Bacteroidetes bacterium]|nr:MAG: VRR-NUC domain protein [Bacteroidota bacterium]
MGVVPGVADLILLVSRHGFGCLCIEMKTSSGDQSPEQKEWEREVTAAGNKYTLCRSFDEFKQTVNDYLK